nr:clip-associated protein [Quercus suber]
MPRSGLRRRASSPPSSSASVTPNRPSATPPSGSSSRSSNSVWFGMGLMGLPSSGLRCRALRRPLQAHFNTGLVPSVVERLGDAKQPVRDTAQQFLLTLKQLCLI